MTTIIKPTTVISVRGRDRAALMAEPDFTYIGRCCAGWPASPFGNPFKPRMLGIDVAAIFKRVPESELTRGQVIQVHHLRPITSRQAIEYYEQWLRMHANLMDRLPELKGRRLGCWCHPKPCHGDVLKELTDSIGGPS